MTSENPMTGRSRDADGPDVICRGRGVKLANVPVESCHVMLVSIRLHVRVGVHRLRNRRVP